MKNFLILLAAAAIVALPFIFRKEKGAGEWREGDPVLVAISPHIAVIRDEFADAFSEWHREKFGSPVKIDWRLIGGTTEIMRYLQGEFVAAHRGFVLRSGGKWHAGAAEAVLAKRRPADPALAALWEDFRARDAADDFSTTIDVFFGGGTYDHASAEAQGLTVPMSDDVLHITDAEFPEELGGEQWRSKTFFAAALSGFGICSNPDRVAELGIERAPSRWDDLADPRYFGQVGVTDPTKSGSVAKAFEMIIHSEMARALAGAGWSPAQIAEYEQQIAAAKLPAGELPDGVPQQYQADLERAWLGGLNLVRLIGANARYFTDGAGKVPVDVAAGDAAAGISIDFYSRVQAEVTKSGDRARLDYVTPLGGSSVSGDPISVLRGAPHPETARRFMRFVLSPEGQRLWNYRPGEPGGPKKSALRRLPVLREFYPSADNPELDAKARAHAAHTSDDLLDPAVDSYHLAKAFEYHPRWTSAHFGFFRQFVRAACMDSSAELRAAWQAINAAGGAEANPAAMSLLELLPALPEPVDWRSAATYGSRHETVDYMREWTKHFRATYRAAEAAAKKNTDATAAATAAVSTPTAAAASSAMAISEN